MKKHIFYLSLLACFAKTGNAQDQLFKKDNSKMLVKIVEINPDEVKYKLHSNLNGPVYSEARSNVSLIVYESGQHEVITPAPPSAPAPSGNSGMYYGLSHKDSLIYFQHQNNLSINFFNFFNNELGITYQREFFKGQFNIIIPVAFGLEVPNVTQSVYFGRNNRNYGNSTYTSYDLRQKLFDVGFGINYYPSLRTNVNYYIGPVFKYMQFSGTQTLNYYVPPTGPGGYGTYNSITENSTLSRYTMSITNGVVFRTRSRITASLYGSLGFKYDTFNKVATDPTNNVQVNPTRTPVSVFFWCGFNVGFNF